MTLFGWLRCDSPGYEIPCMDNNSANFMILFIAWRSRQECVDFMKQADKQLIKIEINCVSQLTVKHPYKLQKSYKCCCNKSSNET